MCQPGRQGERGRGTGVKAAVGAVDIISNAQRGIDPNCPDQMASLAGDRVGDRLSLDTRFEVEAVSPDVELWQPQWRVVCERPRGVLDATTELG